MRRPTSNKRFVFDRDLSRLSRQDVCINGLVLSFLPESLEAYHQLIFVTPPEKSDPALFDHTVVGF